MVILDFLNCQFIDVIEWVDDLCDMLLFCFLDDDKEIKNEVQFIVCESQVVQFVYVGQFVDILGLGCYMFKIENIFILGDLLGWKYKFQMLFKVDVYFVIICVFVGNKWGMVNLVMMCDVDFGVVCMCVFGIYDFKVVDLVFFFKEVVGIDYQFWFDEFIDVMCLCIVSVFSEILVVVWVLVLDVVMCYGEFGVVLLELFNVVMCSKYGLEMIVFVVENVLVLFELEQVIDKCGVMIVIGNFNDYVKYNMGNVLVEGKVGMVGIGVELVVGLVMGQLMMQGGGMGVVVVLLMFGFVFGVVLVVLVVIVFELFIFEQVVQVLLVLVGDVLQELEVGNFKGCKIGSQWCVGCLVLDEFLK